MTTPKHDIVIVQHDRLSRRNSALRFIDLAIHFDPGARAAIDLRVDILTGNHFDQHTAVKFPEPVNAAHPLDGHEVPPWVFDELQHSGQGPAPPQPLHPLDPGVPGRRTTLERPRYFETP